MVAKRRSDTSALTNESFDVAILMCTYNGAIFLRDQLDSFDRQSYGNWVLHVSDDASTDTTLEILAEYQKRWGEDRLKIYEGPCQGFAKNFLSLLKRVEIEAHFYAFSDQDDIWYPDKLERSICAIDVVPHTVPSIYCSRTQLVDIQRNAIGFSPLFSKPPSFRNALVQSLAGANTMTINQRAREILIKLPEQSTIVSHDWLAYLLITGCGGKTLYDANPSLEYRQHGGNLIGANNGLLNRIFRLRKMLSGRFVEWNDANLDALQHMRPLLTSENKKILDHFIKGRHAGLLVRLSEFRKSGVYRQTFVGNVTLLIAALLAKL